MAPPKQQQQDEGAEYESASGVPTQMINLAEAAATSGNDGSTNNQQAGHDVAPAARPSIDTHDLEHDVPPPAYGEHYGSVENEQDGFGTNASVADDGRVNIRIDQRSKKLSSYLVPALRHQVDLAESEHAPPPPYIPPSLGGDGQELPPPPMNVVIQVVGSRGDVQPFVALGKVLKETYNHRVRLATHPTFSNFVRENGLEFFSIGGDPAELMAFMVKNPGLMPGFDTLRSGDVGKRRKEVAEYVKGCWRSCYEAGDGTGAEASDESIEDWTANNPATGDDSNKPFVADVIIANPPSFAHIHCAEKLGIPLHIMFTMPYSPTQAFPHPLANIQSSNADPHLTNYMSYALVDMLTWQGLGDVINRFREKSLGLEPVSLVWAPGMLQRLKIPHTYCWSPALIPKPKDWGQHISISGFYFLNLATNFTPDAELKAFLDAGPPPVYIGFGSIVLDDPNGMTQLLFEAVRQSGQRALVSKGWGGMGADELGKPDGVYMLGNVPHDWLFKQVSCVVHHGGAGTTAAGITAGRPTVVVPFFGDQPFWGSMVARAGAGPDPIPHKQLTAEKLADAIKFCLRPESQNSAHELANKISKERGSDVGAQSFHQMLEVDKIRCNIAPSHPAVWHLKRTNVRLSSLAACTLANEGLLDFNDLKLFRSKEYETDEGPWDPVTGGATALVGTISTMMMGVAEFPVDTLKALRIHPEAAKAAKEKKQLQKEQRQQQLEEQQRQEQQQSEGSGIDDSASAQVSDEKSSTLPRSSTTDTIGSSGSGASTPATSRTGSSFNVQESLAKIQSPSSPGSKEGGGSSARSGVSSSMANALRGQLEGSKSRSRSGSRSRSQAGTPSGDDKKENPVDTIVGTGKGIRKIFGAGFSSPADFTLGLSKGFHNAPKLYGDDTVRKHDQVTDLRSGLKAAGKEFGYGFYDGISGLVTQPMRGAQKEGPAGFVKGFAKGIGGIALKPGAAIFGLPGYTMKGMYKEMQRMFGSSVQNYIIAARTAQGFDEWRASTPEERGDIVRRWQLLQKDIKKKRNPDEMVRDILEEQRRKRQDFMARFGSRSRSGSTGRFAKSAESPSNDKKSAALSSEAGDAALKHANTYAEGDAEDEELKEAIRLSVQQTSRGNPEEDATVERAIQATMTELRRSRTARANDEGDDEMQRAIQASKLEAEQHGHPDTLHDEELERVLAQSLKEQRRQRSSDSEWDSDSDTEDDEDYKRAIQASQEQSATAGPSDAPPAYDRGHVAGTTQEEFESQQTPQGGEKSQQERNEEQVVLDYVKKQSMLEEEHRQKAAGKGKEAQVDREDDEELAEAMRQSLLQQGHSGQSSGKQ
ncbi:UDP-Glycosyltransferase/glycogen phosphorylase [Hortaea werneckii]|nr:UDP-Glycosyltransferase/glycogen phosphorylase [Hortaea werneckii]